MYYEIATQREIDGEFKFYRGEILHESQIDLSPSIQDRYVSMFGFDQSINDWVKFNKTVSGFNGHHTCKYVYFDVDNENLDISLESARILVKNLYGRLNVNPKCLFISFSGSKGFHIGLHQKLFGGFEASKTLPEQVNFLAVKILATAYDTTIDAIQNVVSSLKVKVFENVDLGIYNANRIFRTINSRNHKSGLYKIGLTSSELFDLTLDQIKGLAAQPRPSYRLETAVKDIHPIQDLRVLWQDALRFDPNAYFQDFKKGKTTERGKREGAFFSPPSKGGRNNDLFAQACMLFDRSDLNEESVRQLVSCINLAAEDPLPESEVSTIVKSASKRTEANEKPTITAPKVENTLETFNVWFDEWVDYYTSESKKLTCCFPEIDEDNENHYIGKLACIIGKGGSRKSYYVQNLLAENIVTQNARVLYSSMEMGKVEVVNRLLDIICEPEGQTPASIFLKGLVRQDKDGIRKAMKDTMAQIDENLILSNQSFMTCEDYEKMIEKTIAIYGSLDILVVDGLSAMGGKGTETEIYSRNSLALKEIAKKYNLFVALICHTTKEAKPYDRDPKDKVRGSEKILDNCDFTISFSQLIDPYRSEPENLNYNSKYGHLKYHNKRGTGATVNKIFYFQSTTKKMIDNAPPMYEFPTYEKFVSDWNKKKKKSNDDF